MCFIQCANLVLLFSFWTNSSLCLHPFVNPRQSVKESLKKTLASKEGFCGRASCMLMLNHLMRIDTRQSTLVPTPCASLSEWWENDDSNNKCQRPLGRKEGNKNPPESDSESTLMVREKKSGSAGETHFVLHQKTWWCPSHLEVQLNFLTPCFSEKQIL